MTSPCRSTRAFALTTSGANHSILETRRSVAAMRCRCDGGGNAVGSIRIGNARDVQEPIEIFGPGGPALAGHAREVRGDGPNFQARLVGGGNDDPAGAMLLLKRSGFGMSILDGQAPCREDGPGWRHRGRAHAIANIEGPQRSLALFARRARQRDPNPKMERAT
jgi:hypothetical protein